MAIIQKVCWNCNVLDGVCPVLEMNVDMMQPANSDYSCVFWLGTSGNYFLSGSYMPSVHLSKYERRVAIKILNSFPLVKFSNRD